MIKLVQCCSAMCSVDLISGIVIFRWPHPCRTCCSLQLDQKFGVTHYCGKIWKFGASMNYLIVSKVCPQPLVLDHHQKEEDGKDHREADEDNLEWKLWDRRRSEDVWEKGTICNRWWVTRDNQKGKLRERRRMIRRGYETGKDNGVADEENLKWGLGDEKDKEESGTPEDNLD